MKMNMYGLFIRQLSGVPGIDNRAYTLKERRTDTLHLEGIPCKAISGINPVNIADW